MMYLSHPLGGEVLLPKPEWTPGGWDLLRRRTIT
jgi:hypothetical protein